MIRYYYRFPYRPDSFSQKIFSTIFAIFLASASFFMTSCEEDPTTLGKGLLPGSDFVSIRSIDTIKTVSYTMYDKAVKSGNSSTAFMGSIWDPAFGTTTASFATQLRLKYEWQGNKTWTADSLKLILQIESATGGTTGTNTLSLYEIDKQLSVDSSYNSNDTIILAGFKLVDIELPKLRTDTINNVAIKLPVNAFANRVLRDTAMLFHSNTVPDFRTYFKGMYFTINSTSATDPLLAVINLKNNGQGYTIGDRAYKNFFVLYMHDFDGNKQTYYFILDAANINANLIKYSHNFNTALADKKIQHRNDFYKDSLSYLQALNGVYTRILMPGLKSLKGNSSFSNIAVNKARLTIPYYYDASRYSNAALPSQLYLRYRTNSGKKYVVPDLNLSGDTYHSFFDGTKDTINHVYNFNIASFIQQYLEDKTGDILPELEVIQGSGTQNVIFRVNNNDKKTKFVFTYTQY